MFEAFSSDVVWIVVIGFLVAFLLAFGVGANDVANSFGTSVGSGVLTLREACILATIFETLGALLMGFKVSDTVRNNIFDANMYEGEEKLLLMGMLAALLGSAVWNLTATFLGLPISGTHSIVGAMLGFTLVAKGFRGIQWKTLGFIVSSWFVSPLLSGLISLLLFLLIQRFILSKDNSRQRGLSALPSIYGYSIFVNVISVVLDGSPVLSFDVLTWWQAVIIAAVLAIVSSLFVYFYVIPKERIKGESCPGQSDFCLSKTFPSVEERVASKPEVDDLFRGLQGMTAIFGSFAHGGNDVSNAIAPLVSLWLIFSKNAEGETPVWLLIYGGIGISVGLWTMGRRVIQTMGHDLTKITPTSGFTIEMGAATTVLLASKLGLPISTTHCKVGSVILVGCFRNRSLKEVNFKLFRSIILAWLVTLPLTALLAAFSVFVLYAVTLP